MRPDPRAWGIQLRYRNHAGRRQRAPTATIAALLEAMNAHSEHPPASRTATLRAGATSTLPGAVAITTEDGEEVPLEGGAVPVDLPLGYHRVTWQDDSPPSLLVSSPGRCHLPAGLRTWGWALQLYALRSERSWGMGDLGDLAAFVGTAGRLGAGMTMLNPLHAVNPGAPQQASPYYPSSRCWRNPLYIRVEDVAGADSVDLHELVAAGRALNAGGRIDRDRVWELKLSALERLWRRGWADAAAFERYVVDRGAALDGFATFAAIVERCGRDPARWSHDLRHPRSPGIARFRRDHRDRIRFHSWLQWLLERQLVDAAAAGPLVHDVAVGVDPRGADAWLWQDVFAHGATVGAPPDTFNARGQDWGVLPFDPWALRAHEYEPFIATLRAALAPRGGVRLDHVMGLWRLFWIPRGAAPPTGAYVRYPAAELLDILALESHRSGAFVIGEDLGTVERGVRGEMAARAMLSYRLVWFEPSRPRNYPKRALAAVTNHDLPTVAGVWTGRDREQRLAWGLDAGDDGDSFRRKLVDLTGVGDDADAAAVISALYGALAEAPSALLAATLEDALGVTERVNHPGTTVEWPNWCLPLPEPLERIEHHVGVRGIAAALRRD